MRIIAGQRRGHKIDGPRASAATRPTSDLVRESLFNILGELVVDRMVIDLFAGTGALGLEALSRGAGTRSSSSATARMSADHSQHRHAALRGPRQVKLTDAYRWARSFQPPDERPVVVFLDPPYREYEVQRRAPEPDDRPACREFAGRLGDRARGGADPRRADPAGFPELGHPALRRHSHRDQGDARTGIGHGGRCRRRSALKGRAPTRACSPEEPIRMSETSRPP